MGKAIGCLIDYHIVILFTLGAKPPTAFIIKVFIVSIAIVDVSCGRKAREVESRGCGARGSMGGSGSRRGSRTMSGSSMIWRRAWRIVLAAL
jgi:hypothetical protein